VEATNRIIAQALDAMRSDVIPLRSSSACLLIKPSNTMHKSENIIQQSVSRDHRRFD